MIILIDAPVDERAIEQLKQLPGVTVRIASRNVDVERAWPVEQIADVEIFLGSVLPLNIADMPRLRLVQLGSSGYSQLAVANLPQRNVRACNARGVSDCAIAEWNIAMMICLARDLRSILRNQAAHTWDRSARFQREIRGSRVGIWGYGGIGRETARLCRQMGLSVHALTRTGDIQRHNAYHVAGTGDPNGVLPDRVYSFEERFEFLEKLDFLILAMPHTRLTEEIVGVAELKALPRTAFLLNPARGPLVKEAALMTALREPWIAGAALDAHFQYPLPPDHPLWNFENVILTPHVSGSTESPYYIPRLWDLFIQNVQRYVANQPLLNELSADQLAGC